METPDASPRSGSWADRSVLVTGCTGFLGSWVTKALVARGARVTGLSRDPSSRNPVFTPDLAAGVELVRGSVCDGTGLVELLRRRSIEGVFHLAAQALVGAARRDPVPAFETNVRGTWTLLEAVRTTAYVTRVVLVSSEMAAPRGGREPTEPYLASKRCAELVAASFHGTFGTPVAIARCTNLFGPGDLEPSRIVPGTVRAALEGRRPVIRSDGTPERDYVHVEDLARGLLLLAERLDDPAIAGRTFSFAAGRPVSVLDLTRMVLRLAGREDLEPDVRGGPGGDPRSPPPSAEPAAEALGWHVAAPLERRLEETVAWHAGRTGGGG